MADEDVGEGEADDTQHGTTLARRVSVPLWMVGLALLALGVALGVVGASIVARDRQPDASVAGAISTTTGQTTTTDRQVHAPLTTPSTATTEPVSSSATVRPTTTLPEPRGGLVIVGPSAGDGFGQGFANGPCATWQFLFKNNSNTEIVQVVFAPASGSYSNFAEFNPETQRHAPDVPADPPAPVVLDVSLPPYSAQIVNLETCTETPEPTNPNYEYSAALPGDVPFTWVTGASGMAQIVL